MISALGAAHRKVQVINSYGLSADTSSTLEKLAMAKVSFLRPLLSVLVLGIAISLINLIYISKPGYAIYAQLFNNGQLYEGETRTAIELDFITVFILPISFLLALALSIATRKSLRGTLAVNIFFALSAALSFFYLQSQHNIQSGILKLNNSFLISALDSVRSIGSDYHDMRPAFIAHQECLHNPAHPAAWREYMQLQESFAVADQQRSN